MESIYYVLTWACHRRCKHCYDTRFRPYVRDALEDVLVESDTHFERVIGNLPSTMIYQDPKHLTPEGKPESFSPAAKSLLIRSASASSTQPSTP